MEALNQAYRIAVEQLQKLSSGGKLALGIAVVLLVVGSFFYSQQGALFNSDVELFAGRIFTDEELMQAQAAFAKVGLNQHQAEAGRIRVPKNQQARYVKALVKEDALPLELTTQLESKISSWGMFVDPQAKQEILRLAKQNQLAQIIQQMPDIHKVWVVLDKQQTKSLRRQEQHTASVSVQAHSGHPIGPYRTEQIRELVVRSVAGLNAENVAVIDINGESSSSDFQHAGVQKDPYLSRLKTYQEHYRGLVLNCLAYIPGVTATVHVELPQQGITSEASVQDEVRSMAGGRTSGNSTSKSNQSVFAQFPLKQFLGTNSSKKSEGSNVSSANRPAALSNNGRNIDGPQSSPTVTVAIGIPQPYFKRLWQEQQRDTENELRMPSAEELNSFSANEITRIRQTVAAVIPHSVESFDIEKNVHVSTFVPFAVDSEPTLALAPVGSRATATKDYELWLIAGFIGACVLLVVFWKPKAQVVTDDSEQMETSQTNPSGVVYEPSSHHSREAEEAISTTNQPASSKTSTQTNSSTKDSSELRQEMASLVQNDPEAAAQVLKSWIGNRS